MRPTRGDGLLSPTALLGLALWLLNDHVLQRASPGVVSGKLGDVASLMVLPLATQAALELLGRRTPFRPSRRLALFCCAGWALAFTLMETTAVGSWAFRASVGLLRWPWAALRAGELVPLQLVAHVADVEDLLTLPAVLLPAWSASRRAARAPVTVPLAQPS